MNNFTRLQIRFQNALYYLGKEMALPHSNIPPNPMAIKDIVVVPEREELQKYMVFVNKLLSPPPEEVPNVLIYHWNLGHCGLGVSGEWLEFINSDLDNQDQIKELGDIFYYICATAFIDCISIEDLLEPFNLDVEFFTKDTAQYIEELVNQIKKKVYYRHKVNLKGAIVDVFVSFALFIADEFDLTLSTLIATNTEKLSARYPKGTFDQEHAELKMDATPPSNTNPPCPEKW